MGAPRIRNCTKSQDEFCGPILQCRCARPPKRFLLSVLVVSVPILAFRVGAAEREVLPRLPTKGMTDLPSAAFRLGTWQPDRGSASNFGSEDLL